MIGSCSTALFLEILAEKFQTKVRVNIGFSKVGNMLQSSVRLIEAASLIIE